MQTEIVYLDTTLTTSSCRVRVKCGMAICLGLEQGSGVRVRVVTRVSDEVMVRFYFAVVLLNFFTILHILHCADVEWELR